VISQINRRCVLRSGLRSCLQLAPAALPQSSAGGRLSACAEPRILQPRWPYNYRLAPAVIRPVVPLDLTCRISPVSYLSQCRPWRNFRIAPDVILRLPVVTNSRLAPFVRYFGPAYHAACSSRCLPHASPGLAANLRPSPKLDLHLASHITPGLHRRLQASALPVTQPSACAVCCVLRLSWRPARCFCQIARPSVIRRRPSLPCIHPVLSPSVPPPSGFRLAPNAVFCGFPCNRFPVHRNLVFHLPPASASPGLRRFLLLPVIPVRQTSDLRPWSSTPARHLMKPSACAVCAMSCLLGDQPSFSFGCCFTLLAPDDQPPLSFEA